MIRFLRSLTLVLSITIVFSQEPETLLKKGNSQLSSGYITDAEITFNSILKIDPGFAPAMQALSKLYLHKGDLKFIQSNVERETGNLDRNQNPTITTIDGDKILVKR